MAQAMTLASRGATLRAAVTGAARFDSRASFERSAFAGRSRRRVVTNAFFGKKDDGEKKRIGDLVNTKIEENTVIVWSKSYCPFCVKAKKALDALEVPYEAIEIDRINEERLIQDALQDLSKQRTVPNVFVNGKHVGGCDDTLAEIASGKLQERLKSAGVSFKEA
jgi:glutaredoxin 3